MKRTESDLQTFLAEFCDHGNEVTQKHLDSTSTSPSGGCAGLWLDTYLQTGQCALPCSRDGELTWYVFGDSPHALAALREPLLAFGGPTLSTFRGLATPLSPDDPQEQALLEFLAPVTDVYKLTAPRDSDGRRRLAEGLRRLHRLQQEAQSHTAEIVRDTWSLVRDLELCLQAGAPLKAQAILDELRRQRRLGALNLESLQIRIYAEMGDWAAILNMPGLPNLVNARRAAGVTRALVTALYRVEIAPFEAAGDAGGALAHFSQKLWPPYAPLFDSRRGLTTPEVTKSFFLAALADTPARLDQVEELLALPDLIGQDREWLQALCGDLASAPAPPETPPADILGLARARLDARRPEEALDLLSAVPPTPAVVAGLLEAAYELQTSAAEASALQAYEQLSPEEREKLESSRIYGLLLSDLKAGQAPPAVGPPADWLEWLGRCLGEQANETLLLSWAERGSDEWPIAPCVTDPQRLGSFLQALQQAAAQDVPREILTRALPQLLQAFQQDPQYPRQVLRVAYNTLAEMLVLGLNGVPSAATLDAYVVLLQALYETGITAEEAQDLIDGLELLWGGGGARLLPGVIDGLDMMMTYSCPPTVLSARAALATRVLQEARHLRSSNRVDETSWALVEVLARELGMEALLGAGGPPSAAAAEAAPAGVWGRLQGSLVGLYTLSPQVANRVGELLREAAPECTVVTNDHEVASDALRDLAGRADYFVMVTRSAKHAATDCIRECRPAEDLVIPQGRGASSILRALAEYLGNH